jgi:hypothetical protein
MASNDFECWFQASHQGAATYAAFLQAQREYEVAFEAVRQGDTMARQELVSTAVRLRAAQIEVMYFVRHGQRRPVADSRP